MEGTVSSHIVPKRYDESFKRQVVEMVVHGDGSVLEVAKELGVSDYSIYQWKKKYFSAPGRRQVSTLLLLGSSDRPRPRRRPRNRSLTVAAKGGCN